jgi:nucleoside-diphosphate-sugar epimerase
MYGYSSAAFTAVLAPIFDAVKNGRATVEITVPEDSYIATCHVDDVAEAVRLAAEHIETIGTGGAESGVYPIFDISSNNESLKSVLQQFADVLGDHKGKTRVHLTGEATDMYLAAVSSTIKASSARARQYLGWTPKRVGMGVGLEVYARAWQAGFGGAK